jgi:hypothetical protein
MEAVAIRHLVSHISQMYLREMIRESNYVLFRIWAVG